MTKENSLFLEALKETFDEDYEVEMCSLENKEDHVFSDKQSKKMAKIVKRQKKPYFRLISTAGRRAACIVVAVIVFSASAMSVKAVRETVYDFFVRIFSDHNVVTIESGTDEGYPTKIEDVYAISAIPEGFEKTQYGITDFSIDIFYTHGNQYILFTQTVKSKYKGYYDNEHSQNFKKWTDDDGQEYMLVKAENDITYIWDNGRYIFEICSNLDNDTVLNLCKSTKVKQ